LCSPDLEQFTLAMTKDELLALAVERNLLIAPVSTVADLLGSAQLAAREYFRDHDPPDRAGPLRYAGPFAKFSRSPILYPRPAPRVDEHGREIRDEISVAPAQPPRPARPAFARSDAATRPLEGVKIVDLMWAVARATDKRA